MATENTIQDQTQVTEDSSVKDHLLIERGNTSAKRKDLYTDITSNLNQLLALARIAQEACACEIDLDPGLLNSYLGAFHEITTILDLRIRNIEHYDPCWDPNNKKLTYISQFNYQSIK